MINQYNNDNLPYQNKIVGMNIPDDIGDIQEGLKLIIDTLANLYGIVIAIFGGEKYVIHLNANVPIKTKLIAEKLAELDNLEDELIIIPFPKKT